ncbi:MAG TPA: hypothetical protein VJ742_03065 [Nitrososphaera sp.]|nr:hypothetical protein [Nitrososphaera sp.]
MEFKFQKRRGIGNVITTLIILIASVVLGAGVIFFGGSMFQTNTQSESIKISNVHSWVTSAGDATTAFVVQNTGSKAVTVSSISLRGVSVPTASWFYTINNNQTTLQTELGVDHTEINVSIGGVATVMSTGSMSLAQGEAAIVYLDEAGNINSIDAGNTYSLQIQAGQATAVQQVQVVTG